MKLAPNRNILPKKNLLETVILLEPMRMHMQKGGRAWVNKSLRTEHLPFILDRSSWRNWRTCKLLIRGVAVLIYLAGSIEPIMINAIGEKTVQAGVLEAKLYKIPDQKPEKLEAISGQAQRTGRAQQHQF